MDSFFGYGLIHVQSVLIRMEQRMKRHTRSHPAGRVPRVPRCIQSASTIGGCLHAPFE